MPKKNSSTCRLFADDSFLYKMIRNQQDAQALQQDLTNVQEREKTWKMSFNPSNCEVIGITRKRAPVNTTYLIHDHPLCTIWMKQGKYHGVILSDKLIILDPTHWDMVSKKANNTLAFLRRNISRCPRDVNAINSDTWSHSAEQTFTPNLIPVYHTTLVPDPTQISHQPYLGHVQPWSFSTPQHVFNHLLTSL